MSTSTAPRLPRFDALSSWWSRAGAWLVRWGEQSRHHRMGSWTRRPWHP
ncbi:MAG TPA: hypothetical protein VF169_13565 [Albitalea sp.]